MDFVQHILNGLLQGCILALIGLGFSLVWGILNIINLAHAAFIMLAAYVTYFLWSLAGVDPFISLPLAMLVLFGLGYILQRYVINLVMGATILTTFLLTFGFESLLVNLALRLFSADTRQTKPIYANASFSIGPLYVPYTQLGAVVVALLLTYLLYLFLDHTRTGSSIRAVGQDRVAARLMGIDIGRTYALTFGIAAAPAPRRDYRVDRADGHCAVHHQQHVDPVRRADGDVYCLRLEHHRWFRRLRRFWQRRVSGAGRVCGGGFHEPPARPPRLALV